MLLLVSLITLSTTLDYNEGFDWAVHIAQKNTSTQRLVLPKSEKTLKFKVGKHKCVMKPSKQSRNSIFAQQQADISCRLANGGSFELTTNTCRVLNFKKGQAKSDMTIAREMAFNLYRKLGDEASFKLKSKGKKFDVRVNCEPAQVGKYAAFQRRRVQVEGPELVRKSQYSRTLKNQTNGNRLNGNSRLKHQSGSSATELFEGDKHR